MRTFVFVVSILVFQGTFWLPQAQAQTETDARQLFEEGNEHLQRATRLEGRDRQSELRQALNLYHRSISIARARSVIFNIALCYELLERYQDAFSYYTEYLGINDLSEENRATAEERMRQIHPHVALLEVNTEPPGATIYVDRTDLPPRGVTPLTVATQPNGVRIILELDGYETAETLVDAVLGETHPVNLALSAIPSTIRVNTDPPGAEVRFDDENGPIAGITPLVTTIPPGTHRIYATLEDRAGREVITVDPGGETVVVVALASPTTPGLVQIEVDAPGTMILVNGDEIGAAPIENLRLTPGIHRISVIGNDEYENWSDVIEIGPGHEITLDIHLALAEPQRRFGIWPSVGFIAAAAIGVASAALGGWALSLHSDFDQIEKTCTDDPRACSPNSVLRQEALDLEDQIHSTALASDILLGLSLAIGIASFALALLNREIEDSSRARIAISPNSSNGAFASLRLGAMMRM